MSSPGPTAGAAGSVLHPPPPPLLRRRTLRLAFIGLVTLFVGSMLGLSLYSLQVLQHDAIRAGLAIAEMHSRAIEDFLTENLRITELAVASTGAPEGTADEVARELTAALHQQPLLRSLSLLDAQGRIVASTNPANVGRELATDDYLPRSDQPLPILRVGTPWRGRDFADGQPVDPRTPPPPGEPGFVPLARALASEGRHRTLLVALNPDYLVNHVQQRLEAEQGEVRLLRLDGTLLIDSDPSAQPGQRLDTLLRELMPGGESEVQSGRLQRTSGGAGLLTAFRISRLYPLLVVTDLDRERALDAWRKQARTLLSVVLPVLAAVVVLALVFYRRQAQLTEQRAVTERLRRVNAASVFMHAQEGIVITDAEGAIIDVNEAYCRLTGYSAPELLGRNPRMLASGRHDRAFFQALWASLQQQGHWTGEVWNRRRDGGIVATLQTISVVRDADGVARQYVGLLSDITALKLHEAELERIAHYDALTGLPNRVLLADRLQQSMIQALRRGQRLAVAYLDLDGFKAINDGHGHEAGDRLLTTVAQRMRQALREGDTLARLGGDEFVAVLLDLADVEASVPILNRLLAAASQPVLLDGVSLHVSASVGVTFFPQGEEVDADQLLRQSDQAMYRAKAAGKHRFRFFDDEQDRSARGHHDGLNRVRQALDNGQFTLHYQPKVNLRSGEVIGIEALIRWQDPDKGLLLPALFLPLIEDHRLAVDVGSWVITQAVQQIERWQAQGLGLGISVNVCARQLQQHDFVDRLRALLQAHPAVAPARLELEVQELNALQDLSRVTQVIVDCQALGVRFALDDFGTGYASINSLRQLPVHQIKIDASFVHHMLDDPDELSILDGVLRLAAAFHRQVLAKGVETPEQGARLLQMGCELAQGWGIARPMTAPDLERWLQTWRANPHGTSTPSDSSH